MPGPVRLQIDACHARLLRDALAGLSASLRAAWAPIPPARGAAAPLPDGAPWPAPADALGQQHGWAPLSPLAERVRADSLSRRDRVLAFTSQRHV